MIPIIVSLVLNALGSSVWHQNFILSMGLHGARGSSHSFLRMPKIIARMIISYAIAECVARFILQKKEKQKNLVGVQMLEDYFVCLHNSKCTKSSYSDGTPTCVTKACPAMCGFATLFATLFR